MSKWSNSEIENSENSRLNLLTRRSFIIDGTVKLSDSLPKED